MAPSSTPILLGPPELHRKSMDSMISQFDQTTLVQDDRKSTTSSTEIPAMDYYSEYRSPTTFPSTGNPCLDFFFRVVPGTKADTLKGCLQLAWEHDALKTLKLICNLRGVRGMGKSDKEGFYTAALWMHKHHPKTLAFNVGTLAQFGYLKDLPEILYRILEGPNARETAKEERLDQLTVGKQRKRGFRGGARRLACRRLIGKPERKQKQKKKYESKEAKVLAKKKKVEVRKEKVRENRESKRIAMAQKVIERYGGDPDFRFLYESVSDLFSGLLKLDLKYLKEGELNKISLAAKWCPSIDSSFDKSTLLCESIAKKVFDRESYREYQGVEEAHYAYRVRDRLRKEVLVPLRKVLDLPEVYIGAGDWGSIPYDRVTAAAMKLHKDKFLKHDRSRFMEYLENVNSGKATIAAGALLPHEIITSLHDDGDDDGQVAELQWKRMVDDLALKGKLKNCMAICDVSQPMNGTPMEVSIALGLLVSELSEEPWKGKLITYCANPELQLVIGEDLRSKVDFVKEMECCGTPDFKKVFDLILEVAVNGNLREDQMIKRVFVFSSMLFDQESMYGYRVYEYGRASMENKLETTYEAIVKKYTAKGYGSSVPEVVFWNLKGNTSAPIPGSQPGVTLVSGFSKNLLTFFLEDDRELNPECMMEAAIAGDEYKKLVVLD